MEINLENFDDRIHQWHSVADEPLPLQSHKFNPQTCSFLVSKGDILNTKIRKCQKKVLDQRLLPHRTEFVAIECLQDGFDAIKQMKVCVEWLKIPIFFIHI
jgi:hypothetical protein